MTFEYTISLLLAFTAGAALNRLVMWLMDRRKRDRKPTFHARTVERDPNRIVTQGASEEVERTVSRVSKAHVSSVRRRPTPPER